MPVKRCSGTSVRLVVIVLAVVGALFAQANGGTAGAQPDTYAPPAHYVDDCVDPVYPIPFLLAGSTIEGKWNDGCLSGNRPVDADRPSDGDYYARYHPFSLSRTTEVVITLESSTDTYLYLLSGAGKDGEALRKNDDIDRGNLNSRIEATLDAGVYTIEATTYDPAAGIGELFMLTLEFTADDPGIPVPPGANLLDFEVLVALYYATNGDDWHNNENWLSDRPLREWHGVHVDADGRVVVLSLGHNELVGTIPPELGNLSHLQYLVLGNNRISGEIPPELGNLSHLRELALGYNRISGEIPPELGRLANLNSLWLEGNELTGGIPSELTEIHNPKGLFLSHNYLTGEIPSELSLLGSLVYLELEFNQLTGPVPPELGNLTYLNSLILNDNSLSGQLPQSLTNLRYLQTLHFHDNAGLCAPDDAEFQDWTLTVPNFTGDTCDEPPVVDDCVETLSADGTISGVWTDACLSDNRPADDKRPRGGDYYARYYTFRLVERSDVTITLESETDTYLYVLNGAGAGGNALHSNDDIDYAAGDSNSRIEVPLQTGEYTIEATTYDSDAGGRFTLTVSGIDAPPTPPDPTPLPSADADRAALVALYNATNGDDWRANTNWLTDAPLNQWYGVRTNSEGRATELRIGWNNLMGQLPSELGNLRDLRELWLNNNSLSGEIPPELGNLTDLEALDFGDNKLTGAIPVEMGDMVNLTWLSVGSNQLTGKVPDELGNLVNLKHLILHANQLMGELPESLTSFNQLIEFRFDSNSGLCAPDSTEFQEWLQSIATVVGINCSDNYGWSHRPVFDGGIDLGVTYIERLPRYPSYMVTYFANQYECPYPFDEPRGPIVCPEQDNVKRWPDAGETVDLRAHIWNFGDTASGPFNYRWLLGEIVVSTGRHEGLETGGSAEIPLSMRWPGSGSNPTVTFEIDPDDSVLELLENNNTLVDWIKGYTLGFYFTPVAYESLRLSNEPGQAIQSPEHWIHGNVSRLNELLAEAGLDERVRAELFHISEDRNLASSHNLRRYMDGWWGTIDNEGSFFTLDGYQNRPEIDWGLLHELLHQLGTIDLYQMRPGPQNILLRDANRPGYKAGCGEDYWTHEWICYEFPKGIGDIMSGSPDQIVGAHTAGGLRSNTGHRRGFYGEYLYDTPQTTSVRVLDSDGSPTPDVSLRFYQYELQPEGHILDATPEFTLTTDTSGVAVLPNLGITGIVTATGHQLKPNPFGHIDVVGTNGLFIIEMEGAACTNYEWLTIVDLNLAYWNGQTGSALFDRTFRCPPPSGSGMPSGIPADAGIEHRMPPTYSPYTQFAPQTDSRSTPAR